MAGVRQVREPGTVASPRRPLTIALVSSTYWPIAGGVETYNRRVAHALAAQGHTVRVAARFVDERPPNGRRGLLTRASAARAYQEDDVKVHVLGCEGIRRFLLKPTYRLSHYRPAAPAAAWLTEHVLRPSLEAALRGCDAVHYSGTGLELLGFVALRTARRMNVPFVVTSHMHIDSWGDGDLDMRLYRRADRYVALTKEEATHVATLGVPEKRTAVIGHGVNVTGEGDGSGIRRRLGINGPLVLYLGRKAAYKGFTRTIKAAPHVWQAVPETHFVLAGPDQGGHTKRIRAAHRDVLQDERVHELGFVSAQEREDLYDACTIYCLPSDAEAYGLVYLEAWAYGKPVVALGIPTLQELIGETSGGLLAEHNAKSVAEALTKLLREPALRERLGQAGQAHAHTHTWDRVATHLCGIYQKAHAEMR